MGALKPNHMALKSIQVTKEALSDCWVCLGKGKEEEEKKDEEKKEDEM